MIWWLLVATVVLVALVSMVLLRRRHDVWLRFAERHGLEVLDERDLGAPTLRGRIEGRAVLLRSEPASSDKGALGVEVLTIHVGLRSGAPSHLKVAAKTVGSDLVITADDRTVPFEEDTRFDEAARVEADDAAAARAYLTPARRAALVELFDAATTPELGLVGDDDAVGGAALFARWREATSDVERLEGRLAMLLQAAAELDAT